MSAAAAKGSATPDDAESKKEIYTYEAPWPIYGMAWSMRDEPKYAFRFALGSFIEEYCNVVRIVRLDEKGEFQQCCQLDHPYPATNVMWKPSKDTSGKDLLATTGDYLRIWCVSESGNDVRMESLLNNNKSNEYCAPLTSFDWCTADPSLIATSSIDTTCTVWDINTNQSKTQLIAHDKSVYDIAFMPGSKTEFSTVGADGSVRMFDLRHLKHSTITFENEDLVPLLRVEYNPQDPNYLAVVVMDSPKTLILDVRMPCRTVGEPKGHTGSVNAVAWAPHSSCHICTAGDDAQALIWDLIDLPRKKIEDPVLAYTADAEINQLRWPAAQSDWVSISYGKNLQVLRV
mmetsp:Transcript_33669/g.68899  ORF Transcript_33669/g.68899 Transcript_33669/m.68899 type:complete len:345 (+) Transcript_33669:142-1176(+)